MIYCKDCEFFKRGDDGEISFGCDPFTNIKEPECLSKWVLIKVNQMAAGYQATLEYYKKLAPMQEKMFKFMEHEMDDVSEADKWRTPEEDQEQGTDADIWDDESTSL